MTTAGYSNERGGADVGVPAWRHENAAVAGHEERLRAWIAAQSGPRADDAARARSVAVGQRPERMTKLSLVAISHALERAALAAAGDEPSVIVALFQRIEHFERERVAYARLAEAGVRVVVGFCDQTPLQMAPGIEVITLDPGEALVDEWSVVALSGSAGAFLVATDQHEINRRLRSREAGREFLARWGFSHVQTGVELARLRLTLGARLHPETIAMIDKLLAAVMPAGGSAAGSGGTAQELWSTTAALHLAERMNRAHTGSARLREQLSDAHAAAAAEAASSRDPQSGLTTSEFLHRWSTPRPSTALPVGLGMFHIDAPARAGDERAGYHAARKIAAALTQPLGPVDAALRLDGSNFLIIVPGASPMHLARICDDILDQLSLASEGYPYLRLDGMLATVVTRQRPLPLADLHQALDRLTDSGELGPVDAGATVAGDRITLCRTAPPPFAAEVPALTPHDPAAARRIGRSPSPAPRRAPEPIVLDNPPPPSDT